MDKGTRGEYLIYKRLRKWERSREGGRFLFNLYVPKNRDQTTEIDVVLLHSKGIFVFESKNYDGWIFGNETNRTWTQVLPMGKGHQSNKEQFLNPIRQNGSHIRYLKKVLGEQVPMWSIVVFSDESTFKDVTVSPEMRFKVIRLCELKSLIRRLILETESNIFSKEELDGFYEKLYPFTQVSEQTKLNHIKNLS